MIYRSMLVLVYTFGVFLTCGIVAVIAMRRAKAQAAWPQVRGTVLRSAVEQGNGFFPAVEYTYVYDARVYRGERVYSLGIAEITRRRSERVVLRYPAGTPVTVFVDPRNPANSVLEPGGDPRFPWFFGIAGGIVLLAFLRLLL